MSADQSDGPLRLGRLAARLLPPSLRDWGAAAVQELRCMDSRRDAWVFALGCLGWACREAVAFQILRALSLEGARQGSRRQMRGWIDLTRRPRTIGALCAVAATTAGLAYMTLAGAPARYLLVNLGALAFGFIALAALGKAASRGHLSAGGLNLALGLLLLGVSLFGASADGVTRWVTLAGLSIQPGLIVVPLVAVLFARSRDGLSLLGLGIAAAALAVQPDRGTAGALAAGLMALALVRPDRSVVSAALAATAGFGVTLARPDPSPAVPYVDQILHTASAVHPVAGLAVLFGSALLMVPALAARRSGSEDQAAYTVFGALWAALVAAAALGNYPTPLVGYGGSAIIGYLVSLMAFPSRVVVAAEKELPEQTEEGIDPRPLLVSAH